MIPRYLPLLLALGAGPALPSWTTATPPGTGLFRVRLMKPSAWAGRARRVANSRQKTRNMGFP